MHQSAVRWTRACIITIVAIFVAGCASRQVQPDLKSIYTRSAQYHGVDRNPVIVIPGILGSKLKDDSTGRIAWGAFTGTYISPNTPEGRASPRSR